MIDGNAIKSFRASRGMTQGDLAALLRVTPTAVTYWEKGQPPSGPALLLLEWLIEGKQPFSDSASEWDVQMSLKEWEELEQRRIRRGFPNVRAYLVWLVRQDVAKAEGPAPFRITQIVGDEAKVAEDEG